MIAECTSVQPNIRRQLWSPDADYVGDRILHSILEADAIVLLLVNKCLVSDSYEVN